MSDETPSEDQAVVDPVEEKDWKAEAEKWKALSRQNEAKAKENFEKAKRLDEIEEASKTELEKVLERATKAEQALAEFEATQEREKLAAEVAQEFGLTDASILSGNSREELVAHAEKIRALIPEKPKGAPIGDIAGLRGTPLDGVSQIRSREELKTMTPEEIVKARNEGRLDQLLGVNN